jgi:hypothetical protein
MTDKQKSLRDVAHALDQAFNALEEIQRRALYENPPKLSFEQRVIAAARGIDNGDPLKGFLTSDDLDQAINTLADIYTITGVLMPDDWY